MKRGCFPFVLAGLAITALIVAVAAFVLPSANAPPASNALATASEWARLAPLPAGKQSLTVQARGSEFTREFVITFTATPQEIQQWLLASPGTSTAKQSVAGLITTYSITPGGGAAFAEVQVNQKTGLVTIKTYWS